MNSQRIVYRIWKIARPFSLFTNGPGKRFGLLLMVCCVAACVPIDTEQALDNLAQEQAQRQTAATNPQPPIAPVGADGVVRAEELTMSDGTILHYTVVLPPNYAVGEPYPTLLALPPGSQTQNMVDAGLDSYWRPGAMANGWVVISPVAPSGELFFQGAERYMAQFLPQIAARYPPEGEKFHLGGVSNGGISAFRVAGLYPEWFHSLLALPGYAQSDEDQANLSALTALPMALFVGANDAGWIDPMRETVAIFNNRGGNATLEIVDEEGHFIRSLMGGERLFALLAEFQTQN